MLAPGTRVRHVSKGNGVVEKSIGDGEYIIRLSDGAGTRLAVSEKMLTDEVGSPLLVPGAGSEIREASSLSEVTGGAKAGAGSAVAGGLAPGAGEDGAAGATTGGAPA